MVVAWWWSSKLSSVGGRGGHISSCLHALSLIGVLIGYCCGVVLMFTLKQMGDAAAALIGIILLRSCCSETIRAYVKALGGRWECVVLCC